jgi:hypothetical protein
MPVSQLSAFSGRMYTWWSLQILSDASSSSSRSRGAGILNNAALCNPHSTYQNVNGAYTVVTDGSKCAWSRRNDSPVLTDFVCSGARITWLAHPHAGFSDIFFNSHALHLHRTYSSTIIIHPGTGPYLPATAMLPKLRTLGRKAKPQSPSDPTPEATTAPPTAPPAREPYVAGDFSVDDYRPLKVICIGAGFSGILCAIRCADLPHVLLALHQL